MDRRTHIGDVIGHPLDKLIHPLIETIIFNDWGSANTLHATVLLCGGVNAREEGRISFSRHFKPPPLPAISLHFLPPYFDPRSIIKWPQALKQPWIERPSIIFSPPAALSASASRSVLSACLQPASSAVCLHKKSLTLRRRRQQPNQYLGIRLISIKFWSISPWNNI